MGVLAYGVCRQSMRRKPRLPKTMPYQLGRFCANGSAIRPDTLGFEENMFLGLAGPERAALCRGPLRGFLGRRGGLEPKRISMRAGSYLQCRRARFQQLFFD